MIAGISKQDVAVFVVIVAYKAATLILGLLRVDDFASQPSLFVRLYKLGDPDL